jgi:hypothetical protein
MNRSKRLAQQLGMAHGTAANRLRKIILFSLLVRLKENFCFKCNKEIKTELELSIEHKLPWEGRDTKLFWDLNNISFSHLGCNRPHKFYSGNLSIYSMSPNKKTQNAPIGKAWCSGHKDYRSIEDFHFNIRNINKVASYCKECRKIRLD